MRFSESERQFIDHESAAFERCGLNGDLRVFPGSVPSAWRLLPAFWAVGNRLFVVSNDQRLAHLVRGAMGTCAPTEVLSSAPVSDVQTHWTIPQRLLLITFPEGASMRIGGLSTAGREAAIAAAEVARG